MAGGDFFGCVNFSNSGINQISGLHITAPDKNGNAATFDGCEYLEVAEGTFPGAVSFRNSGVEKIGDLRITAPDQDGNAACFNNCLRLKIAEGTFPGFVDFENSGVETVGELSITKANTSGHKANFRGCDVRLSKEFLGPEYLMDDETRQKIIDRIATAKAIKASPEFEI